MRVVTGTGRSGTAWMAEVLRRAGVEAGHEQNFSPGRMLSADSPVLDVSAWVLPWLRDWGVTARVAHQVRRPLDVMRSFLRMGFYTNPPSPHDLSAPGVVYRLLPQLRDLEPAEAAARHWIDWNAALAEVAEVAWRVEDVAPAEVAAWVGADEGGIGEAMASVPRTLHHFDHGLEVGEIRLTAATREELRVAAARYGYDEEE